MPRQTVTSIPTQKRVDSLVEVTLAVPRNASYSLIKTRNDFLRRYRLHLRAFRLSRFLNSKYVGISLRLRYVSLKNLDVCDAPSDVFALQELADFVRDQVNCKL